MAKTLLRLEKTEPATGDRLADHSADQEVRYRIHGIGSAFRRWAAAA
mgnify:CR=1 FL=1